MVIRFHRVWCDIIVCEVFLHGHYAVGQASEPSEPSEPIGVTSDEYVPICVLQYTRDLG